MKNKKVMLRLFSIVQWTQEQEFLRQEHQNGWKFTKLKPLGLYYFEKCRPEDVVYQLDYNPDGNAHKAEYVQMFRDCGWEYLQNYAGYSYFRKPASQMEGDEEIFCDDASRLEFMKRMLKGYLLPLVNIFILIIIPQLFIQSRIGNKILTGIFAVLGVLYLVLFLVFAIQFWRYRKGTRQD